jgi:NhaP-type Na+/H+ or K+/H+ antiporter
MMEIVITIVAVFGLCCTVGLLLGWLVGRLMAADHDRRVRNYLAEQERRLPGDKS